MGTTTTINKSDLAKFIETDCFIINDKEYLSGLAKSTSKKLKSIIA